MKPPLHGGINCSILDGWWPEAYDGTNGWAIGGKSFDDPAKQDAYDARSIYTLLETQLAPTFYTRDRSGLPKKWIAMMKGAIQTLGPKYNSDRMVEEYARKIYS